MGGAIGIDEAATQNSRPSSQPVLPLDEVSRAVSSSGTNRSPTSRSLLQLQRLAGNRAVGSLLRLQRYALTGGEASALAEGKYASAEPATGLKFTKFSSCIGVAGRKDGKIIGAHLVRVGADGAGPEVESVVAALDGIEDGIMFGFLNNWEMDIKSAIASPLEIYDWQYKEVQSAWHLTHDGAKWVLNSL